MAEHGNIQVMQANFEALNQRNEDAFRALRTAEFAAEVPGMSTPLNAEESWRVNRSYMSAFPDVQLNVIHLVAQGDYVVALYRASGTHTQPMRQSSGTSIPATGKTFAVNGCSICEIKESKITRQWDFADMMSLFSQLGIKPQWGCGR